MELGSTISLDPLSRLRQGKVGLALGKGVALHLSISGKLLPHRLAQALILQVTPSPVLLTCHHRSRTELWGWWASLGRTPLCLVFSQSIFPSLCSHFWVNSSYVILLRCIPPSTRWFQLHLLTDMTQSCGYSSCLRDHGSRTCQRT